MFVNFFIQRPVFATVCALLIVLAGAAVIPTLPISQFPNLAPPQVGVTSVYIGASAQTVESAVTIPIEQQINGAEGMKYITSTSGNDGTSSVTATFDLNRDPDLATVDIQNRVNTAQGRLARRGQSRRHHDAEDLAELRFRRGRLSPTTDKYSTLFMSNYLDVYVRDSLKRIPGVADVIIFGERKYSMRLWLDPVRMAGRGLTAPDVVNALSEQNVEVAAGQVGQQPSMPGQQYQVSVRAVGRLSEAGAVRQHHSQDKRRWHAGPAERRWPRRAGRGELRQRPAIQRAGCGGTWSDAALHGERARCGPKGHCRVGPAVEELPSGNALQGRVRYDRRGERIDPRRGVTR